jgi:hypothetical protein
MPRAPYIYHIEGSDRRTVASFTVKHELQSYWESLMPEQASQLRVVRVRDGAYGRHDYRTDITDEIIASPEA